MLPKIWKWCNSLGTHMKCFKIGELYLSRVVFDEAKMMKMSFTVMMEEVQVTVEQEPVSTPVLTRWIFESFC